MTWEDSPEVRKGGILKVVVSYCGRAQIKLSKEKGVQGGVQERRDQAWAAWCPPPVEVYRQHLIPPCDDSHEVLKPGPLTPALVSGVIRHQSQKPGTLVWLRFPGLQSLRKSADTVWPTAPHKSHCELSAMGPCLHWHSFQAGCSKSLEVIFEELSGPGFSLECAGLKPCCVRHLLFTPHGGLPVSPIMSFFLV